MNKSGDENRSVRNTKRRLREGLLSLLAEKSITQITVKELTDLVDINRGTFYFHYSDIYDMLHKTEDEFFDALAVVLNRTIETEAEANSYLTELFAFIKDNQDMAKILLGKNSDIEFVIRLKKLFHERSELYWKQHTGNENDNELSQYSAFIIAGCVGVIKKWLDEGLRESPEEISRLAGTIIKASLKPYFLKKEA